MGVHVVSIQETVDQPIPPNVYTLVKFSYVPAMESYDVHGMHNPIQPDGSTVTDWQTDPRSGLFWPSKHGFGYLIADFAWEDADYTEIRDQFVRDPLGTPDATGTKHQALSPGMQYLANNHGIFVNPTTPIGVMVRHNASAPVTLTWAQFKLIIHDVDPCMTCGT